MRTNISRVASYSPIYSLGNFVSNMKTADTRGGAMARLKIYRDDDGKARLKEASYRLLFTIPGKYEVVEADSVKAPMWQGRLKLLPTGRVIFSTSTISRYPRANRLWVYFISSVLISTTTVVA